MLKPLTMQRLWQNAKADGRCLIWQGAGDERQGGKLRHAGKNLSVSRLSWELQRGPIPDGLQVLHKCDRRLCIRLGHLFLGTNADNMKDKARKGRAAKPWLGKRLSVATRRKIQQTLLKRSKHGNKT